MSDQPTQPRPPIEVRVGRRIFQVIYGLLLFGFVSTIAVAATYGAFHDPEPTEATPPTSADCQQQLRRLFTELDRAGQETLRQVHRATSEAEWKAFSDDFRGRLASARAVCGADAPEHADRAVLIGELERQRLGYETARRALAQVAGAARAHLVESFSADGMPAP